MRDPESPNRPATAEGARRLALALVAAIALSASSPPAFGQNADRQVQFDILLLQWEFQLDLVEDEVSKEQANESLLEIFRPQLAGIQRTARSIRDRNAASAAETGKLLATLGPPPPEGDPAEAAPIRERRADLEAERRGYESREKQSELFAARASQLESKIASRVRAKRASRLLERGPSPLSWAVLGNAPAHLISMLAQLIAAPAETRTPAMGAGVPPAITAPAVVVFMLAALAVWTVRRWLGAFAKRDRSIEVPSFARRVLSAVNIGLRDGVLPALVTGAPVLVVLGRVDELGILGDMVLAALIGVSFVILVNGLGRAALAPGSLEGWRLSPLTDKSARSLFRRIRALSVIAAVFVFLWFPAGRHLEIPIEFRVFYGFLTDTVLAVLVLSLLPRRLWQTRTSAAGRAEPDVDAPADGLGMGDWLRILVGCIAVSIPLAGLVGYAALASYLTVNLILTGILLGVLVIAHGLARDVVALLLVEDSGGTGAFRQTLGVGDSAIRVLHFWIVAAVNLALAVTGIMLALTIWGVGWAELREWIWSAIQGIRIGSFTLSITDLLAAIAVFVVVLAVTRTVQRLLETGVFPQTSLDVGIRHSLKTAIGYVGLVIGGAFAISVLGLDLSNIALIAGALSVGIGFGLQNVVNNFISGVILLVERPLKVGDWVVVGAHQGYVRRIDVRATEIQTFQRSSVIIPNSELISSAVVNWTHKDSLARVEVAVGVAYGSDLDAVREVLLECARTHPKVSSWPQPFVLFLDFGASSLDFELRCFVGQADERFLVASDLRFAIEREFRSQGIQIPFPQRDLHIRSAVQPAPPESTPERGNEG